MPVFLSTDINSNLWVMTIDEAIELVEVLLAPSGLTSLQELVFRQAWLGLSYAEMANTTTYDYGYIKDVGAGLWKRLSIVLDKKVTKQNIQAVLSSYARQNAAPSPVAPSSPVPPLQAPSPPASPTLPVTEARQDWGEAVDTAVFYGRTAELSQLKTWICSERCRLIALLGMGGMGKTTLAIKLGEELRGEFDCLVWRSLRDAPTATRLLADLLQFLAPHPLAAPPTTIGEQLSLLIDLLRQQRCLLILDNFETLLQGQCLSGRYQDDLADYGELLRRVAEIAHGSCVIITSREKPTEVSRYEGPGFPVRSLMLPGLDLAAGMALLEAKGLTVNSEAVNRLLSCYQGNPLALKIVATSVHDLLGGNMSSFLEQEMILFNGIAHLLQEQIGRLSPLEQQVMTWIALHREPLQLKALQQDLVPTVANPAVAEAVESLRWRSLVECSNRGVSLQPVVMEFVVNQWLEQITQEIVTLQPQTFHQFAILKAVGKDYLRENQIRTLLDPLVNALVARLGTLPLVSAHLHQLLEQLRQTPVPAGSYAYGNLLHLWWHLQTDLTGLDLSGCSLRQTYLAEMNLPQVNFRQARFQDCVFAEISDSITCVAFSPDGQHMASSDASGMIQIWDLQHRRPVAHCLGHNHWVWCVSFSADGQWLASCGQDKTVRIWNVQTGGCFKVLVGHRQNVTCVAFAPDAPLLASCGYDQTIKLWDIHTGLCQQTLTGHTECIWSLGFTPDGQTLISGGEDLTLRFWHVRTGDCWRKLSAHQAWIKSIAISPRGDYCASASFDQTTKLWDLATGTCLQTLQGHILPVSAVTISPDGQTIATSSYDQTVRLWSAQTGRCHKILHRHTQLLWTVAFHPSGQFLASGGDDNQSIIWELATEQPIQTHQGQSNSIYSLTLNPAHAWLATGHEDQAVRLWPLETPKANVSVAQPQQTLRGHQGRVLTVVAHPQTNRLASGSTDRSIRLWSAKTGRCLQTLLGHKSWIWALAFSPNGQRLASASYDHTVRLWDPETGACLRVLSGHPASVLAVAFEESGRRLASSGYARAIRVWDVETGACLQTLAGHHNQVWAVCFVPQTPWLATGGDDRAIHLWDLNTGTCALTLTGHQEHIIDLGYDADHHYLISTSADHTLKVWDLATGQCCQTLTGHHHWVWAGSWLPQTQQIISASQDETLKWWDIETGDCLATLRLPYPYEGMDLTGTTGLTDAQKLTLQKLGAILEQD
jgi:WD40 repeat protein